MLRRDPRQGMPQGSRHKIKEAWLSWRIVIRTNQHQAEFPAAAVPVLDLNEEVHVLAQNILHWYEPYMLTRRIRQVPNDIKLVVFDGNAKLRRWRVCGGL